MRWEALFDDLESQMGAVEDARFRADVEDRLRAERAGIEFAGRLLDATSSAVSITLVDGQVVSGEVVDAAMQWVLIGDGPHRTLIPMHAVAMVRSLPARSRTPGQVERRLTIGHALRALSRDRARVAVDTRGGTVTGVIAVVGADYLELSEGVGQGTVIPLASMVAVRSVA